MVAAAAVGAAAVGAVGSTVAANSAAGAQESAAQDASNTQMAMYNTSQQDLQPYMQLGTQEMPAYQSALTNLGNIQPFSYDGSDLTNNPAFQFASTQGLKAVENSNAARGLGYSGAQIKGAENFETGTAEQYYQNYYNQALQTYDTNYNTAAGKASSLSGAVQMGGNAAAGAGNNAINTGNSIAANITGAGNAAAGADIATGNAVSGAASGVASSAILNNMIGGSAGSGMYGSSTPAVMQGTTNGVSNSWGL
jgi:hypothetical protein